MKALKTWYAGRNSKPATVIPVPDVIDPEIFLAMFVESWMSDGYIVVGSYKNPSVCCVRKRGDNNNRVLVIQLTDIAEMEKAAS